MDDAPKSLLDGLPPALSALLEANAIGGTTAEAGFKWRNWKDARAKVAEELAELDAELARGGRREALQEELGDLLFAVVSLARYLQIDPEAALLRTNVKFARRFRYVEERLRIEGRAPQAATLEELCALWEAAKARE